MKQWRACSKHLEGNRIKYSLFCFDIPDELYEELTELVKKREPLFEHECGLKLAEMARAQLENNDGRKLESLVVEDPGDRLRIIDKYEDEKIADSWCLGEKYEELDNFREMIECGEDDMDRIYIEYTVNRSGMLYDFKATAQGFEGETEDGIMYGDCLPDYKIVDNFFDGRRYDHEDDEEEVYDEEYYCGYPFAMEVTNGAIISMTEKFQKKLVKMIMEKYDVTEEELAGYIYIFDEDSYCDDYEGGDMEVDGIHVSEKTINKLSEIRYECEDCMGEILGFSYEERRFTYEGIGWRESEQGWAAESLISNLGIEIEENAYYGPHGHGCYGCRYVEDDE